MLTLLWVLLLAVKLMLNYYYYLPLHEYILTAGMFRNVYTLHSTLYSRTLAEAMRSSLYYHFQHNIPNKMCLLTWRIFVSLSTPLPHLLPVSRNSTGLAVSQTWGPLLLEATWTDQHTWPWGAPPKIIIHSRLYCKDSECTHADAMRDGADGRRWVSQI